MKKFFLLLPIAAATELCAQTNLPPATLNNTYSSTFSLQTINTGNPTNLTVGTSPASSYQYISTQAIHFGSSFHSTAVSGSTGKMHAFISQQDLDAVFFTPAPDNLSAVPEYSKVEMGLDLSNIPGLNFDTRVAEFLNESNGYKAGTAIYNSAYQGKTILNPYDPDHISVDAVFFRPSGGPNQTPLIRHGFYYKNYSRTTGLAGWMEDPNPYEWRIRMAPDELGLWEGYINIWVDGIMLPQTCTFSFYVVPSANPGYIQIDPQHTHYLKFGGDGSTYFPIGDNFCWVDSDNSDVNLLNHTAGYGYTGDHRMVPSVNATLTDYLDKLAGANGDGGNATRLVMMPWGFAVEWEKLGNYETRQIEMWELDDYISELEQHGVYLMFALGGSGELMFEPDDFDDANVNYSQFWGWNPYCDPATQALETGSQADVDPYGQFKGVAGVSDPEQFFYNTTCKNFYKKRLRYIISRWGYSTAISMYELLGEIDGAGYAANPSAQYSPPFFATSTYGDNMINWVDEMMNYIKNNLQDPHLRAVSFLGDHWPWPGDYYHATDYGQHMWALNSVDVITGHYYSDRENDNRWHMTPNISNVRSNSTFGNKPLWTTENDASLYDYNVHMTDWTRHNSHWASAFSGNLGSNLNWCWYDYTTPNWNYNSTHDYDGEYEQNYRALRTFVSMIDFQNSDYTAKVYYQDPTLSPPHFDPNSKFEAFYLQSTDNSKVYGWFHNRSCNQFTCQDYMNSFMGKSNTNQFLYNYSLYHPDQCPNNCDGHYYPYTYWGSSSPQFLNTDSYNDLFGNNNYGVVALSGGDFYIDGLSSNTDYEIDWYWTWGSMGGSYNGMTDIYTTDANGLLHITTVPPTGSDRETTPGDWAFVATANPQRLAHIPSSPLKVTASPNPSTGIFTLQADLSDKHTTLEVRSLDGRLVMQTETNMLNGYQLDLGKEAEGVYILTVRRDDQVCTARLMKTE